MGQFVAVQVGLNMSRPPEKVVSMGNPGSVSSYHSSKVMTAPVSRKRWQALRNSGGGHGLVGERFQGNARDGRQVTRWGRNSGQSSLRQPSVTGLSRPRQSRWTARLQSQHQMPPMTSVSSSHSTTKTARAVPQPQHISRNWVGVRVVDQQWAGVGCRHDDRRHASRATWLGVKAVKSLRPRR